MSTVVKKSPIVPIASDKARPAIIVFDSIGMGEPRRKRMEL
jgi:hypothetical protein